MIPPSRPRFDPSHDLAATPCALRIATPMHPSAPIFAAASMDVAILESIRPLCELSAGYRCMAHHIRRNGPCWPSRAKADASPRVDAVNTGAPHPSTPIASVDSPVTFSQVDRMRDCRGWSGSRYVSVGHPALRHAASIAACFPEQLWNTRVGAVAPCRMARSCAGRASGQAGGVCSADSSSPAPASIDRT